MFFGTGAISMNLRSTHLGFVEPKVQDALSICIIMLDQDQDSPTRDQKLLTPRLEILATLLITCDSQIKNQKIYKNGGWYAKEIDNVVKNKLGYPNSSGIGKWDGLNPHSEVVCCYDDPFMTF